MSSRRRVLDVALARTTIETKRNLSGVRDRVALVASFGATSVVSRSLAALVRELESGGYTVIVLRASDDSAPLVWPEGMENSAVVVRRPNTGYDFGSWTTGMALFPELLTVPHVLLANDSLVGPFASLRGMLENFESSACDVWGATNTMQGKPHLQSYFLGFKNGILADRPLAEFWSGIEILPQKEKIIQMYEIGLSRLLYAEGYVTSAWFESVLIAPAGQNPSVSGWRRLLQLGFPFVKRQLLTIPNLVPDADEVAESVRARFNEDVNAWM